MVRLVRVSPGGGSPAAIERAGVRSSTSAPPFIQLHIAGVDNPRATSNLSSEGREEKCASVRLTSGAFRSCFVSLSFLREFIAEGQSVTAHFSPGVSTCDEYQRSSQFRANWPDHGCSSRHRL